MKTEGTFPGVHDQLAESGALGKCGILCRGLFGQSSFVVDWNEPIPMNHPRDRENRHDFARGRAWFPFGDAGFPFLRSSPRPAVAR